LTIITAVGMLGGLTFLLASLLIFANRKLFVVEDPRLDVVEDILPSANCGGCGFPSCRSFSEALVKGEVLPGKCSVSTEEQREEIADILKVDVGAGVREVARLACAGGDNVAANQADYQGLQTCLGANQVGGGNKACHWGCIGFGDCAKVCTFDAIQMDAHGLPVVDESKCTACGDCVDICPKNLFSLQAINHCLWVACKNQEMGDEVLDSCQVGCTACARCEMDAPEGLVEMENNLPKVDYAKGTVGRESIERCPTGAIVWINEDGEVVKGADAKKVLRNQALPTQVS